MVMKQHVTRAHSTTVAYTGLTLALLIPSLHFATVLGTKWHYPPRYKIRSIVSWKERADPQGTAVFHVPGTGPSSTFLIIWNPINFYDPSLLFPAAGAARAMVGGWAGKGAILANFAQKPPSASSPLLLPPHFPSPTFLLRSDIIRTM